MNHYTDGRVERPEKNKPGSRWVWILLGLVLIGLVAFQLTKTPSVNMAPPATYELLEPEPPVATTPEFEEPVVAQKVEPKLVVESESKPAPVPVEKKEPALSLDDSDPAVRQLADEMVLPPQLESLLIPAELVRKATVFIDALSKGDVLRKSVTVLKPEGKFSATKMSDKVYILNPDSYHRYDALTEAFVDLNAEAVVSAYVKMASLFEEAYEELGYPDGSFRETIIKAIDLLQQTPVLDEEVQLVRPSVMYKFADSELESLSAAEKQLIRMGPANTRKIQSKLAQIELVLKSRPK